MADRLLEKLFTIVCWIVDNGFKVLLWEALAGISGAIVCGGLALIFGASAKAIAGITATALIVSGFGGFLLCPIMEEAGKESVLPPDLH